MKMLLLLVIVCALAGALPRVCRAGDLDADLDTVRELAAYGRWKEAAEKGAALRKTLVAQSLATDALDEVLTKAGADAKDERLRWLYLIGLARKEDDRQIVWTARFASRPAIATAVRVNFYLVTENGVVYGLSRKLGDMRRGEHAIGFGFDKVWIEKDGRPAALRVELCYAGHAVDVLTEGKEPPDAWWKATEVHSGLLYGQDGYQNPETHSFRFVQTGLEPWSLASVTSVDSTDSLPADEPSQPKLPAPHIGSVRSAPPAAGAKPVGAKPAGPAATPAQTAQLEARMKALETDAVYGPDGPVVEKLVKLGAEAATLGVDDIAARADALRADVGAPGRSELRSAFRIKRLDVQKPTPDNGGRWVATVVFTVARAVTKPFRINLYTLLPNGDLYGSYVSCGSVVWENGTQEFAHSLILTAADVGTKPLKWRAEIGWEGVCCAQTESPGAASKGWWLAVPSHAHLGFAERRRDAPGAFRVPAWGLLAEIAPRDRFVVQELR